MDWQFELERVDKSHALFDEGRFKRIEFLDCVLGWHTHWTETYRPLFHLITLPHAMLCWMVRREAQAT